ncbi:MAG: helix-turn-helix transcriptional regulator [Pseudomonadota bacterium]
MPKKLLKPEAAPSLVLERLKVWGRCIRTQRVAQQILASDLCARMGISDATLRRLERGDPGASAATYLGALMILGILDFVAPMPDQHFWSDHAFARARPASAGEEYENF